MSVGHWTIVTSVASYCPPEWFHTVWSLLFFIHHKQSPELSPCSQQRRVGTSRENAADSKEVGRFSRRGCLVLSALPWVKRWNPQCALKSTGVHKDWVQTWSSKPSEPSSCAASGILVLVFAGLHVVDTTCSHTAAGSWEGHSQVGFPFQPVCLYQGRNTVCLFRWDISLPLELQVTVNVTQALFPVRKGEKICLWIVSDVLPIVREDSIWWRITVPLKSCTSDRDLGQLLLPEMGDLSLISIKPESWIVASCPSALLEEKWMAWRWGWSSGSG